MRIVMLTDDLMIDRRILLEANTLKAEGHEVILLAGWQDGMDEFEIIDGIKVHRVKPSVDSLILQAIIKVQNGLIRIINIISLAFQKIANLFVRLVQKICAMVGMGVYKTFYLIIRAVNVLFGIGSIEQEVFKKALFYDADVYHSHDLPRLKPGCRAAQTLDVPCVYDAHELYPEIHTLTAGQQKRLSALEKRWIGKADAVITVNEFIAEEMAERYHVPLPQVILNATQGAEGFDPDERYDCFRQQLPIRTDDQILLFQGWMAEGRGLRKLIRSLARISPRIYLVFLGYGDFQTVLGGLAEEIGVEKRVHFVKAVPQKLLLQYVASADAGIIPYQPVDLNHRLCSPNKLFEFIQAGIPIIANDLPFLRKVVAGEQIGVVKALDSEADYAEAIEALFVPQERYMRFRKQVLAVRHQYSWQVEETKLLAIYKSLLQGR